MAPSKHASIHEQFIRNLCVVYVFLQIANASAPRYKFANATLEVPKCNDLIAVEEEDFGGTRNSLDEVVLF